MTITPEDAIRFGIKDNTAAPGAAGLPETPTDTPTTPGADLENKNDGVDEEPEEQLSDELIAVLSSYCAAYPKEKAFLVTKDWQVFLPANKLDAHEHAKIIGGEVYTYHVRQ